MPAGTRTCKQYRKYNFSKITSKGKDPSRIGDACRTAVHEVIMQAESGRVPEEICRDIGLCNDERVLFSEWPIQSLPPSPPDWPIERRRSLKSESKNHHHDKDHQKSHGEIDYTEFGHVMTSVFSHIQAEREIDRIPSMGVISMALGRIPSMDVLAMALGRIRTSVN